MNKKNKYSYKDKRDLEIQFKSESYALNFIVAATQILTIICLIKGNTAWKGSLALLFIGDATELVYKYHKYEEKQYLYVGLGIKVIGVALLIWFVVTG